MSEHGVEDLFERFRSHGDAAALGRVFDAVAPALQRIARHLAHDRSEADDLVQATFLAAIEKRDTFDASRPLAPWLTGILLKQASLARRSRARAIEPDRLDSRTSEDPLDVAGAREMSEALAIALARLSQADREVLLPLLMDGRRAVEIARELGRRPDTIHMRIHRGLVRLRRLLPANFALGMPGASIAGRGLGSVRAAVLSHARVELGVTGSGTASIAAASWGIALTAKQMSLGLALLAVSLVLGGYFFVPGLHAIGRSTPTASVGLEASDVVANHEAPGLMIAEANGPGTRRVEVKTPETAPASRPFELIVMRSDHRPAAGALVAVVDSTNVLVSAKANEAGACTIAPSRGDADVYVRDDGALPYHTRSNVGGTMRQTIELPAGQELSGRLTLIGDAPLPIIDLRLAADTAPRGFAAAGMDVFRALELLRYHDKDLVARTETLPDGRFRFHGLPAGWSGTLSLPQDLVFVVDGKPGESSKKIFAAAASNLDMGVAFRPRILGRLVDAATRQPLANASVECSIEWTDGGDMGSGFTSGADGRFSIPLDYRTDAVDLVLDRITLPGGVETIAPSIPKWTGPCEPRDLGDIACTFPPSRPFEVHIVTPEHQPLAGAHAQIGSSRIVVADKNGVASFAAIPLDASTLRVVAPGHTLLYVALAKETASPLTLVLAPTNRLTMALPPEAVGRRTLTISLLSRELLFAGHSRMYDQILRGGMIGSCPTADGDEGTKEGATELRFSPEGLVELEDIRTGVPFRVQLKGSDSPVSSSEARVLAEVKIDSLGTQEQRRIQFTQQDCAAQGMKILRGHVTDENGAPILGALVGPCFSCGMKLASTDMNGAFELDLGSRESTDVEISKRGYTLFRVHDLKLAANRPLEAVLRRGQDLRIEVVDPHGRPVGAVYITAEMLDFGAPDIEPVSTGVFNLCDLPEGTVHVTARVAGKSYESSFDARAGVGRITVPEHGRLEVSWRMSNPRDESKSYQLALRPVGNDAVAQLEWIPWPDKVTTHTFESVLPGEYTIGLEARTNTNEGVPENQYLPLHPPVHVTTVGGETHNVSLGP